MIILFEVVLITIFLLNWSFGFPDGFDTLSTIVSEFLYRFSDYALAAIIASWVFSDKREEDFSLNKIHAQDHNPSEDHYEILGVFWAVSVLPKFFTICA
jgi:hypothetical protein